MTVKQIISSAAILDVLEYSTSNTKGLKVFFELTKVFFSISYCLCIVCSYLLLLENKFWEFDFIITKLFTCPIYLFIYLCTNFYPGLSLQY